jgi:hypothetical protein
MSQFIENAVHFKLTNNYNQRLQQGRFSVLADYQVAASTVVGNFVADLKSTESFQFVGKKKRLEMKSSYSDYSGINKKFINDDGVFEPAMALAEFARAGAERRLIKEDTLSLLRGQSHTDSHEAFLYNMLISWFRAEINMQNGDTDGILRVRGSDYRDSHVSVTLDRPGPEHLYSIPLEAPMPAEIVLDDGWNYRNNVNHWHFPYVVKYSAATKEQEYFYLSHLCGRANARELNGEFNFPPLSRVLTALEPVGGVQTIFEEEPNIDWGHSPKMWTWIIDYVVLNRLEQQFAAVFETFVSATVQPLPHTMEATTWWHLTSEVVLPVFAPTRAKISLALEGEPFVPFASAFEFTMSDGRAPSQFVVASAICNYYMYLGLYAMIDNHAQTIDDWHIAANCHIEELYALKTPYAKAVAISVITGKEFETMMNEGCYYRPVVEELALVDTFEIAEHFDDSVGDRVKLDYLPTYVSGALVIGTIVDTFDSLSHLTGVQQIKPKDLRSEEFAFRPALQFASLYRTYGHDVSIAKTRGGQGFTPYASVKTSIIDPYSMRFETDRDFKVYDFESSRRDGRHASLPNASVLMNTEKVTVSITKPVLTLCCWGDKNAPLQPVRFMQRSAKTVSFNVRAGASSNRVLVKGLRKPRTQSGFQMAEEVVAPAIPVPMHTDNLIVQDTAATSNDA